MHIMVRDQLCGFFQSVVLVTVDSLFSLSTDSKVCSCFTFLSNSDKPMLQFTKNGLLKEGIGQQR